MRELAAFYKVLADEARLQMLWLLSQVPELCVCDLMTVCAIGQSKASRHLAALRAAQLVSDRKGAQWTYYSLRADLGSRQREQLELVRRWMDERPEAELLRQRLAERLERKRAEPNCDPA